MRSLLCLLACASLCACLNSVNQNGGGGGSATGGGATGGGSSTGGGAAAGGGVAAGGGAATGGGGAATGGGGSATGGGAATGGGSATGGGAATGGGTGTGGGGFNGDGGVGDTCGGFAGTTCSSANVCIWNDKSCGATDGSGTCQPRPSGCPSTYQPVCGCDGQVYPNECVANQAGVDVSVSNNCTPPNGYFSCGWAFCAEASSYCTKTLGGAAGNPGSYSCDPFPSTCGTSPSCQCLSGQTCGGMCTGDVNNGLTLTCLTP
ncbi:MAG: Kazal-type serine protease inhibitor domain-containing protein [Myxococcaceae bacterium]